MTPASLASPLSGRLSGCSRIVSPCHIHTSLYDPNTDRPISDRVVAGAFMYLGFVVPAYSYAYFSPTIIRSFGYSAIRSQLLSVPPWACSFVFAMTIATFSDFAKHRFLFVLLPLFVALAGFSTLLAVKGRYHVEYGALFLAVSGVYSTMPVIVAWFNSNRKSYHSRL